jgi:asparagine synthase (glutamine-hydrolysing)
MTDALTHRGPDDDGYVHGEGLSLGVRRLSVIDPAGGGQPISNEDRSLWVVFNGEIYNFRALRAELRGKGHRFSTETDTEVLVHLYEEEGEQCVERLHGMFAFALWDQPRRRLFLARDRLGQKPLFYRQAGRRFYFASEPKGLLAHPEVSARLHLPALHNYLALRFVPSPRTLFRGIASLPPAHTLVAEKGRVRTQRYWSLSYAPKWTDDEETLTERLEALLHDTVRSHLESDVPLGTFLSGGIDSGLMSALVAKMGDGRPPAFSIGSQADSFNELPRARRAAQHMGLALHEETATPALVSLLPAMVHHLDMPGDPIAACQYLVARLAARHVTVAVGGDGGDELFAGYDRFAGFHYADYYAALPEGVRRRLIGPLLSRLPDTTAYKSAVSSLRWLHELSFHDAAERYAAATTYFRFDRARMRRLYGPALRSLFADADPRAPLLEAFGAADSDAVLDQMLHADVTTRLPEHLLLLVDRMTMAHSMEGRLPLVDHRVAEFAARLPAAMKLRGRTLKYLLRTVARRHLPTGITQAPKQGFMVPIGRWLREELREGARQFLLESRLVEAGLFRADGVRALLDEHQSGRVDHHHRLWMLINVEVWFRLYIEGASVVSLTASMQALRAGADAAVT